MCMSVITDYLMLIGVFVVDGECLRVNFVMCV